MAESLTVSHTRLDMLSKCGEMFRRRYIEGHKRPPGVAMHVGRAVDTAVNSDLESKMDGAGLLEVSEVQSLAADTLDREWTNDPPELHADEAEAGESATRGAAVDKSVRLAGLHHCNLAPEIEPTAIQRGFEVPLDGAGYPVRLIGFLDIQEGSERIRDTKTSKKSPARNQADLSTQLSIYALAAKALDGVMPDEVVLDYLVDLKTPKAFSLTSARTDESIEPVLRRIERFIDTHDKGAFIPARPDDWWCSKRWCGYWTDCPFAARPVTVAPFAAAK